MTPTAVQDVTDGAETGSATGPPVLFLLLGGVSVLVSLFLLTAGGGLTTNVIGYLLACLLPILSVGLFRRFDLARRTSPFYVPRPLADRLIPAVLGLGLLAAVIHTWSIATSIAS